MSEQSQGTWLTQEAYDRLSAELEPFGKYVLSLLMLAGRIGPIGLAAALALRQRNLLYTLPEERPIIG